MTEQAIRGWADVPPLWQQCFQLAWDAHTGGSNPIGALVADPDGNVVSTGKSAVRTQLDGVPVHHNELAHAEVNALLKLDNRRHPKALARHYTLYSTMEPCPLCFGSLYMSDVETLRYAARDPFGGSTNLLGTTPYLSRKTRNVHGPVAVLEEVSIFMFEFHDLVSGIESPDVHPAMAEMHPRAVRGAQRAADERTIPEEAATIPFDRILGCIDDG
jgi:tRNA(Arg) A34 adenosine deaminase TadA